MSRWQPMASVVMMAPSITNMSRSAGMAMISLDLSATLTWPSTRRWRAAKADTMWIAAFAPFLWAEPRNVRSDSRLLPSLSRATPSAVSEHHSELIGYPISRSLTTCCVRLELRSRPSPGITRLHRYNEPLRLPRAPSLSLTGVGWSSLTTPWGLPCCVRFPCVHAVATTPAQRPGGSFRSVTQPCQPSPKGSSGRPANRPFRDAMGRGEEIASIVADVNRWSPPMQKPNDLNQSCIVLKQDSTLIAVIEMSLSSWLVAGIVPGVERQPLKKLAVDESALLKLLNRWREEAEKAGRKIERIAVAFEAGRDGFWLARWLRSRGIEAHVIHASSVAVSRELRRAKTDRLDTELLKRAFLGWLRGERDHCKMVAIPTLAQEDAKRPNRERESLVGEQSRIVNRMKAALARLGIRGFNPKLKKAVGRLDGLRTPGGEPIPPNTLAELKHDMERRRLVRSQIRDIEGTRLENLKQAPGDGPHVMVRLLARVIGIGVETADMLVQEVLSRNLRDRRAIARYGGLTGSPDESGKKRREKGLARSGNARVRRGMIQLAWRFLMFQKDSALAHWFYARTKNAPQTRKTMIVALARKLLIALWRLVREGAIPEGIVLRPAL